MLVAYYSYVNNGVVFHSC